MDKLESVLLGRRGLLGRHFIGGTDADRFRYERLKEIFNAGAIRRRRRMADEWRNTDHDLLDRASGFRKFEPGSFQLLEDLIRIAHQTVDGLELENRRPPKPQLYTGLVDKSRLTLDSPFIQFVLQPKILRAVSAYLGVVPILKEVDIWYSVNPGTNSLANSQLWHSDWEGARQVKLFVYASNVGPTNGPLVVMGAQTSQLVRDRTGYTYFERGNCDLSGRISDDDVTALVGSEDQHVLLGPPGTVIMADTGMCLHYGSRVEADAGPRTTVYYQLLTPTAFSQPLNYQKRAPHRHLADPNLHPLQRLVLGADR